MSSGQRARWQRRPPSPASWAQVSEPLDGSSCWPLFCFGTSSRRYSQKKKTPCRWHCWCFVCENVSLRTSCESVHTNPTVLDAAKKGRTNLIALHFQKQKSNRSCGPKKGWRLAYNCKPFGAPRRPLACLHARLLACSLAPLNRIELGLGYPTQACSLMVGSRVDGSNVVVAMHNYRGCACNVGHGNGNAQPSWMVGSKEGVWWWR